MECAGGRIPGEGAGGVILFTTETQRHREEIRIKK
jgi:hypothetical protein